MESRNEFICRAAMKKQNYGHGGREGGRGEMYGESNIEAYNTMCEIDSQWDFI